MTRKILFLSVATLALSACGSADLPKGTQVETGILTPVTISLDRRGTHLFSSGALALAYAESSKVNLREIEGRMIELTGHYEKNTLSKDLPVFVVESARALSEESRSWSFPSFPLALKAPTEWHGALKDNTVQFVFTGSSIPVLSVSKVAYSTSPFQALTATGTVRSSASSVAFTFLSNFRAVRDRQNASRYVLMLDLGSSPSIKPEERVMVFSFTFDSNTLATEQEQIIRLIEQSIRIGGSIPSSVSGNTSSRMVSSLAGSSMSSVPTGQPCGGAAGILCPSGQYCEITDRKENIGRCKMR